MSGNRLLALTALPALAAAVWSFAAEPARACGGFFCSANAPVNQAAERIIFSKNEDGTVTAVVQIQYSGPSEEFAWVLPVPGIPDVEVSSDLAFRRLQQASNPQYVTNTTVEGECADGRNSGFGVPTGSFTDGEGAGGQGGSGGGVTVLASGNVGPYDFVVIQPNAAFDEVGEVAVDWLTTEGYDVVPPGGDPADISDLLGEYLQGGMNLLAFRLTKGNSTGTIRPIWIRYASEQPMIPIRPTAVAANDDMGVMVWVLGEHRAVPINYKSLELNEALIDWTRAGANYNQVVIAAADEAGGQGFVTERAGEASSYESIIVPDFERDNVERFLELADELTSAELLVEGASTFGAWDGYREVVEPLLPDEVPVEDFLNCPVCVQDLLAVSIDRPAFLAELDRLVIEPMLATQALLTSRPYVTRLYTTMSAPEMDLDPLFDFNPDLSDADNVHNATRVIECAPEISISEAPSRFELEDGRIVRLMAGQPWPFTPGADGAPPANSVVRALTTSGEGEVVTNNTVAIFDALADHNETVPTVGGRVVLQDGSTMAAASGCAAAGSSVPGNGGLGSLGLVALALGLVRRRRPLRRS